MSSLLFVLLFAYSPFSSGLPLAFLLAANIVLEVEGQTTDIQSHFANSSKSENGDLVWGPFRISGSSTKNSAQSTSLCEATANGCR